MRIRVRVNDIVGRPLQAHPQVDGAGPCAKLVHAQGTAQADLANMDRPKETALPPEERPASVTPADGLQTTC